MKDSNFYLVKKHEVHDALPEVLIAFFRYSDPLALAVRARTMSKFAHVGIVNTAEHKIIEAWPFAGKVRERDFKLSETTYYMKFSPFMLLEEEIKYITRNVWEEAKKYVGAKYDFASVISIGAFVKPRANYKMFCSELVATCFYRIGFPLLQASPREIFPKHIAWSPYLEWVDVKQQKDVV